MEAGFGTHFAHTPGMSAKELKRSLLDALFPPFCLLCGGPAEGRFPHCCERCLTVMEPLPSYVCSRCGEPFRVPDDPHLCLRCILKKPPFQWCRGLFRYGDELAAAITLLKFQGKLSLLEPLQWAVKRGVEGIDLPPVDGIVPVPIHFKRLMKRGFNQAEVLAKPLAEILNVPILPAALTRVKEKPQVGLGLKERERNVRDGYVLSREDGSLAGMRLILFDDVYTSGATARVCSRVLRRAGATVLVLALARSMRVQDLHHLPVDLLI